MSEPAEQGEPREAREPSGSRGDDAPRRARGQEQLTSGVPALALVRPLAVMAVIAMILGRVLAPASVGLAVGFGRISRAIELAGGIATQLFAMAAAVVVMAEVIAVVKSKLSAPFRLIAIAVGGFGLIVGLSAAVLRVPGLSAVVLGVGASVLAIVAAWEASRAPFARAFGLVIGLFAVAGIARLLGIGAAELAASRGSMRLNDVARVCATLSLAIDGLALLASMAVLASGSKKVTSPLTLVALILAFVATRQALLGDSEDAGVVGVLLRRASERLLPRPEPYAPMALRVFISFLSLIAAFLAPLLRGQVPALAGALALALLARGAADSPLGALILIIAALSVALASRDDRGVWATILDDGPPRDRQDDSVDPRPSSGASTGQVT